MNKDDKSIQDLTNQLNSIMLKQKQKEMDLVTEFSGQLTTGDLIIVANGNNAHLGFYLGRGQGGSMQYYGINHLVYWMDNRDLHTWRGKDKLPFKWFINSPHSDRVSKYSPDLLNDIWIERYERALEAIKLLKVI